MRTHLVNDTLQTCTQAVDVVLQLFGLAVNGVAFWMCQAGRFRGQEGEGIGPCQQQRPSQRKQLILLQKQSHKTSFIAHLFHLQLHTGPQEVDVYGCPCLHIKVAIKNGSCNIVIYIRV